MDMWPNQRKSERENGIWHGSHEWLIECISSKLYEMFIRTYFFFLFLFVLILFVHDNGYNSCVLHVFVHFRWNDENECMQLAERDFDAIFFFWTILLEIEIMYSFLLNNINVIPFSVNWNWCDAIQFDLQHISRLVFAMINNNYIRNELKCLKLLTIAPVN